MKLDRIPHHITNHLIGDNHTPTHRKTVGVLIIMIGTLIAQTSHFIPHIGAQVVIDATGYLVHGIGAIPFLQSIEKLNH